MRVPGSDEWVAHVRQVLAFERSAPLGWWYMSFADEKQFLGALIIQARGAMSAMQRSHELGLNPGGQVLSAPLPEGLHIPERFIGRLLSRAEVDEFDATAEKVH